MWSKRRDKWVVWQSRCTRQTRCNLIIRIILNNLSCCSLHLRNLLSSLAWRRGEKLKARRIYDGQHIMSGNCRCRVVLPVAELLVTYGGLARQASLAMSSWFRPMLTRQSAIINNQENCKTCSLCHAQLLMRHSVLHMWKWHVVIYAITVLLS